MSIQILLIAFGLSMDAFAVAITNGMCIQGLAPIENGVRSATTFGLFQGFMPLIGYLLGSVFRDLVQSMDHWIALILLGIIGGNMVVEGIRERQAPESCTQTVHSTKTLLLQGVATSIDALAVGIGFAVIHINILAACLTIGLVTFFMCFTGVQIGHRFGAMLKDKAQIIGGVLLVLIGVNIFFEHVFLGLG